MKKISASAMCFTFTGCFLGAGYVSGQELYQFFGAFGAAGIVGLFIAVALLGVFNVMLVRIVKSTGDTRIDRAVVGSENKTLLFLVGTAEMFIFFGTYVVMAAGAGALTEMLTGFNGAHIAGSFVLPDNIFYCGKRNTGACQNFFRRGTVSHCHDSYNRRCYSVFKCRKRI